MTRSLDRFSRKTSVSTRVAAGLLLVLGSAHANPTSDTRDVVEMQRLKDAQPRGVPNPLPQVGGDDIESAVVIPALPFSDTGNTCGFLNDYDEVCPYTGSTAPDVVYAFSPTSSIVVNIHLCDSDYDTKAFVYENTIDNLVACNDDACGADGFRSLLSSVPMDAGNTYYIVVDGYFGACGTYDLTASEGGPCDHLCTSGVLEGEPDCFDGYIDTYNGGCNSSPNRFQYIVCPGTSEFRVCGTYGGFIDPESGDDARDTDWYLVDEDLREDGFHWCVTGEHGTLIGYLDPTLGCAAPIFEESLILEPCTQGCLDVPSGPIWLFVATSTFGPAAGDCGGEYVMEATDYECVAPISVEETSWAEIKSKYVR